MKDTDLYRQLLGIESPWEVSSVALDAKALRIDVVLVHHHTSPPARITVLSLVEYQTRR